MSISTRAYVIISAVCLLGVLLLSGTGVLAQDSRLVWSQVGGTPATVEFKSVFMVNEHTAWAVGVDKSPSGMGSSAYKLSNLGGVWRVDRAAAFTEVPNAIVVLPSGKAWIVGDNGLLAQLGPDGSVQEQASPAPDANLLTLQMFGNGEEGWAGGYLPGNEQFPQGQLLMLHYLNGQWAVDESFAGTGQVTSLHFSGSTGYAVTSNGQIWRYSRGWTWEGVSAPCGESIPGCYGYFSGVRALEGGEAWAVGSRAAICGICVSRPYALQRTGGTWRQVLPDQGLSGSPQFHPQTEYVLRGVSFMGGLGIAVGWHTQNAGQLDRFRVPMVISYRNGRWHYESIPMPEGELNSVSLLDATHGLSVGNNGIVLSYGYGVQPVQPTPTSTAVTSTAVVASPTPSAEQSPTPTPPQNPSARVSDPRDPTVTYFPPVGHTLRGVFREYWLRNGGLTQFGFPITEEFEEVSPTDGKIYTVQYFERARFEQHPENRPPYHVLLGLLGRTITAYRQDEVPFRPVEPRTTPGGIYFKETGHNMAPEFADYWRAHGGLPVYGYPISEPFNEVSPSNGKTYLVQYFERNRFEYHPELQEPFRVSLGLLGVQVLRARGWLP